MNPLAKLTSVLVVSCFVVAAFAQSAGKLNPAELATIPDGNYLLTLETNGKQQRLNMKVQANRAKCVKSTDPSFANVEGMFQLHQPGAFLARFRGGLGAQLWIVRPDGVIAVREVPDRGEHQTAVPVKGDSVEPLKTK
jgi:hypothetical protein